MRSILRAAAFIVLLRASLVACEKVDQECTVDQPPLLQLQTDERHSVEGPVTVLELEKENMIQIRETGRIVPFGYAHEDWEEFKAAMQDGDQIFNIAVRDGLFYMNGQVLVRNGCVVRFLRGTIS